MDPGPRQPDRLGRVRLRLALVYGIVAALAVGVLAWMAVAAGTQRLRGQAESDLRTQVGQLIGQLDPANPPHDQYDTWLFDTDTQQPTPLGQTGVEPPFRSVVEHVDANSGLAVDHFSQGGTPYLLSAQRVLRTPLVVVAAGDLTDTEHAVAHIRWRIGLTAAVAVAVTSIVAYVVSGWSLHRRGRPASSSGRLWPKPRTSCGHPSR